MKRIYFLSFLFLLLISFHSAAYSSASDDLIYGGVFHLDNESNVTGLDSLKKQIQTEVTFLGSFSGQNHQNFWITSNRYGLLSDDGANAVSMLSAEIPLRKHKNIDWAAGVDIVLRVSPLQDVYLHQAYLEAKLGPLLFMAGRRETTLGHTFEALTSGSLAQSSNARPIPRIAVSIPDFYNVPFTNGWLEFKGHFAHGWLETNRYSKNALYHDKSVYLQTGAQTGIKFYAGIVHIALWGGENEVYGKLPSGWKDFMKVVVAGGANEGAPANEINALGFHTGVYNFGLRTTIGNLSYHLYNQHLFTDGSGMKYRNLGDGLFGLGIMNPFQGKIFKGAIYEFIDTRNQTGPGLSDHDPFDWPDFCDEPNCGYRYGGRDEYYNNAIYRSGLSYHGLSLGSPIFLTQKYLDKFDPSINTYSSMYFVSNRNRAHHFGFMGSFSKSTSFKILTTYVEYHGTYTGKNLGTVWASLDPNIDPEIYFFNPSQKQWYFMLEFEYVLKKINGIIIKPAFALDRGDLFNVFGGYLGINYKLME